MARLLIVPVLVVLSVSLSAHDFWVEASQYRPKVGALVGLRLLVGQDMLGDPVRRDDAAIDRFLMRRADRNEPVPGLDGSEPAGIVRIPAPGLTAIGYESRPRPIELASATFDQYLGEEGLDEIKSILPKRGPEARVWRERFARCAKALVQSGPVVDGEGDRALGLTFEIVAERNPYGAAAGSSLPFAVTYLGEPKANALIVAINRRDPTIRLTARSDRQGRVRFTFPAQGVWLLKAVHMVPASSGEGADWHSYWASLTFDLP